MTAIVGHHVSFLKGTVNLGVPLVEQVATCRTARGITSDDVTLSTPLLEQVATESKHLEVELGDETVFICVRSASFLLKSLTFLLCSLIKADFSFSNFCLQSLTCLQNLELTSFKHTFI